MKLNRTYRILGKNVYRSNNTWETGLNNNDLIIGPTGSGKTRGYVKPNIMQCNESMVIADTKGSLIHEVGPLLRENGYRILHMDFKHLENSYGYNPLDFIRRNPLSGKCYPQDILTIADTLVPVKSQQDPFWEQAAKMYLTCIVSYVMECLPKEEQNLKYVADVFSEIGSGKFKQLIDEQAHLHPDSYAVQTFRLFENNYKSPRTSASIVAILGEKFNGLLFDGAIQMYTAKNRINFRDLGKQKTAVFLTISDMDRSMDRLISLFYTQALQTLYDSADTEYADHRLPIPVRLILDDFATNAYIPDFHNITSVIRSREIYVSIILQSITQLEALYGHANAATIMNNCDNLLYLGGQDVDTARYISPKVNKPASAILNMKLDESYLFTRGQAAQKVEKFDICSHPRYMALPEAQGRYKRKTAPVSTCTSEVDTLRKEGDAYEC